MDPLALTTGINTLAVAVANCLGDDDLALLAAVLTQLGDTLATIAVQRSLCASAAEQSRAGPEQPQSRAGVIA